MEIGGYIELEFEKQGQFYKKAIYLNSARNGIRYIINACKIKRIHLPYYTCPVVWQAVQAEDCEIIPYKIDLNLSPLNEFDEDDYILYTDYFGVCTKNTQKLAEKYKNLIADNAMAFYTPNYGIGSVYSPRKFFGVPDGGIVISDHKYDKKFEKDTSYGRFSHLIKRVDCGSDFAYQDFNKNDDSLINEPIKEMSNLTYKMLGNVNYEKSRQKRLNNFNHLAKILDKINLFKVETDKDGVPMYYPLLLNNSEKLRAELLKNKIFCPKPWRGLFDLFNGENCENERFLHENLIPLIIDQRYGKEEMDKIIEIITGTL